MGELAAIDAGVLGGGGVAASPSVGGVIDVGTASQLAAAVSALGPIQFSSPVLIIRDTAGKMLGAVNSHGTPGFNGHMIDFLAQTGLSLQYAFGGFAVVGGGGNRAGASIQGYFAGNSRDVMVGVQELDATLSDVPDLGYGTTSGIPDTIGAQITGFTADGRSYTIPPTQQVLGYGLYSAAQGGPVCNAQSFYNFWNNAPSFFSWDFIGGVDGLYSVRTGKRVVPFGGGAGVNFTGAMVNNPNMPLMAVCASGYSFMLDPLGHDPINVIDPTTGKTAVPAGFVQMLIYDGCRQFSANASWGYKGPQPTDRMTATTYAGNTNPGGVSAAGSTEGPQG